MKTAHRLLVTAAEASFQLSLPEPEVVALIEGGELATVIVRSQQLIIFESLTDLIRRKRRTEQRKTLRGDCVRSMR